MSRRKILVVDDEKLIRWSLAQKLSEWNYDVIAAEDVATAQRHVEKDRPDLVLLDVNLPDRKGTELLKELKASFPDLPIVMITAYADVDEAVQAMRDGAYDYATKPIDHNKLQSTVKNALEAASLRAEVAFYKEKEKKKFDETMIVAVSEEMKQIMEMVNKIARSEVAIILLQGESGSGKDLLARYIHGQSRRSQAPYIAVNCSAIPENLLESELFGYEKGAFTDAKSQKKGLVEMADGGTLFLDEIGELSLHMQAKLLRFLEDQVFRRVGGLKDIEVDLRVIAATNKDLNEASSEGRFRRDLFYRLNVCPVHLPPLRSRPEDILSMAQHFIGLENVKFRKKIKGLAPEAAEMFSRYAWPGNVRELKNAIERAMIFEEGEHISVENLPFHMESLQSSGPGEEGGGGSNGLALPEVEKQLLIKALDETEGNITRAAKRLGISRDTLRYRIKKHGLGND